MTTEQTPETLESAAPETTTVAAEPVITAENAQDVAASVSTYRPMTPLAQWKQLHKVKQIQLMQGQGRMFANINGKTLIVGSKTDLNKELFVMELNSNRDGEVIAPGTAFVLINSSKVRVVMSI